MDRWSWTDGTLPIEEHNVVSQIGVRLYDGEEKTEFDDGKILLSSHRLIWKDNKDKKLVLSVPLNLVVLVEDLPGSFRKSPKIVVHLTKSEDRYKEPGPRQSSRYDFIQLSFRESGTREFLNKLQETLEKGAWKNKFVVPQKGNERKPKGGGIMAIEKKYEQQHKQTDKNISQAFTDLTKLIDKAKEMVTLSKNISSKIKEKQGDITADETIKFKSYLLSLGIPDPVTRDSHGTGDKYYRELAKQISSTLEKNLNDVGGIMTLPDVYCRINRSRGMELLSPEDLVNSCRLMAQMNLPVQLREFDSGVMVLQLQSQNEELMIKKTYEFVVELQSLTAEQLSKLVGISVVLSKERLLSAESAGKICRDESVEGLRFYPNYFLTGPPPV